MKRVFPIFLILLFSLSLVRAQPGGATAAPQPSPDEAVFLQAVNRHREEFGQLKASRAAVVETDPRVSLFKGTLPRITVSGLAKLIRENLPPGSAVLFFNYDDDSGKLRSWLIDQRGIAGSSSVQAGPYDLQKEIVSFRMALGIEKLQQARAPRLRDLGMGDEYKPSAPPPPGEITKSIDRLSALFLPPGIASGMTETRHLIIVPILEIGTVPFALLQPAGTGPLIDRMSISVAPSLFDVAIDKPEPWSAKFEHPLIVGNPQFTTKSRWVIPPLPGAEKEAIEIAELLGTKPMIGDQATKRAVLDRVVAADLVYFATHGVGDRINSRDGNFLIFAPEDKDMGFWTMAEIMDAHQKFGVLSGRPNKVPLQARLAVLSACQTGVGEAWQGGLMSLGRAMQASGIPRVVMSLWNVNDQATAELMRSFVLHLRDSVPAEALRQAMVETRAKYPEPAKWAAFVYFGMPY
jgi:hypothetical protein